MHERIGAEWASRPAHGRGGRPRALGLFHAVMLVLALLRRNLPQAFAGELFGISQPTVSRLFTRLVPVVREVLAGHVPALDEVIRGRAVLVDGTLARSWNWRAHPELRNGKHRASGFTVQLVTDLGGRLLHVAEARPGSTHDVRAYTDTGLAAALAEVPALADLGYLGTAAHLPVRKPRSRKLTDAEKECRRAHAALRAAVERGVATLKTWRILDSGYRGPIRRFSAVLDAVIALEFFRTGW